MIPNLLLLIGLFVLEICFNKKAASYLGERFASHIFFLQINK